LLRPTSEFRIGAGQGLGLDISPQDAALRKEGDAIATYKVKFRQDDKVVERQIKADGMMFEAPAADKGPGGIAKAGRRPRANRRKSFGVLAMDVRRENLGRREG
jgi:hypothetical protein